MNTVQKMFPAKMLRYAPDNMAISDVIQEVIDNESVGNGNWEMSMETILGAIPRDDLIEAVYMAWAEHDEGKTLVRVVQEAAEKEAKSLLEWEA